MKGMSNLEKKMIKKGIINSSNQQNTLDHSITPVNSNPKITPINPLFRKSRIGKSKRFNSTNGRYKNVINKMEKDNKISMRHVRKWSQGKLIFTN